jgi:signal peptidase I
MNTLLLLTLFFVGGLAVQATVLWLAARVCRLPKRSWGRALAVSGARLLVAVGLWLALVGRDGDPTMMPVFGLAVLVLDTLLTVGLIRGWFGGRWRAVIGAWALQAVLGVVVGLGLTALIQTCIATYVIPTSSMNPNIRGYHVVEVLPDGNHLVVAANDPADPRGIPPSGPSQGIIAETYVPREVRRPAGYAAQADRIVCNKTKVPERWDAVVFRHPQKTEIIYVKRLLGLPGESIVIRDGAVWVNGERQSPPERLGPIRYRGSYRDVGDDAGSEELVLGPDEFFVLGDNTTSSSDSRDFGPVKRDLIIGVADVIYWPPARWRARP